MKILPFCKSYEKNAVLDFAGAELRAGEICAVIGANGSGKSTLAKVLSGIVPADKKVPVFDMDVRVGYLPQKGFAYRMTVRKNILLGGNDEAELQRLAKALQLGHLLDQRADKLSGGETARMALARLLMKKYDLVILDEPTAAMDIETSTLSEELVMQYVRETGCALLLITHSLQQARRMADTVMYMHKGKLAEYGPKETVLYTPERPETKQFLDFYGA